MMVADLRGIRVKKLLSHVPFTKKDELKNNYARCVRSRRYGTPAIEIESIE